MRYSIDTRLGILQLVSYTRNSCTPLMSAAFRLEVTSLPINPSIRNKLLCSGFRSSADLDGIGPVDLATEAQLTHEEALLVLKLALPNSGNSLDGAISAKQIFEKEAAARKIITFCSELDAILGGGVATGQITEFCGMPGVGKTQLGMQLAVDVQIPREFGGLGGEAVYIDTEGSFMVERCQQMVKACVAHLAKVAHAKGDPEHKAALAAVTPESMLDRIHCVRARDHVEQLAAVQLLPSFVEQHPAVRLVVVDSVTFHFRQDFADMAQRTRQLAQMAQQLMQLAGQKEVAVVLMNQVTTKVVQGGHSRMVPALGDSWAHAATSRVILYWEAKQRKAFIYKSPTHPAVAAEYSVVKEGVRGPRRDKKRPFPE